MSSLRLQGFQYARTRWEEAFVGGSDDSFIARFGVTEATLGIEGRLKQSGLSEHEARVISSWGLRACLRTINNETTGEERTVK
ncbi:hypothetical protein HYW35_02740 [Candidatus Saccharibacteria bacterium]|nr:hypothetical protein [Candidatus Saccharibacteria bacterium]